LTFAHDATFKNLARSAAIPRDSIDHGATGHTVANKNNPARANAAKFERTRPIASVHQFAFSPRNGGFFRARVPISLENYRFSNARQENARCSQQTEKREAGSFRTMKYESVRADMRPRKTADSSEDSA
jgi:hypothetical protein